jgi:tetratricopeptide (TPR) repeat protein
MDAERMLEQARDLRVAGRTPEAVDLLRGGLASGVRAPSERAALLRELSEAHLRAGDWTAAHTAIDEGLALLGQEERKQQPDLWAARTERKAWTLFREGKLEEAYAVAVPLQSEPIGDPLVRAALHNTLAGIEWNIGRPMNAAKNIESAMALFTQAGDRFGAANAQTNLGILEYTIGRWSAAEKLFASSEALRESIGAQAGRAANLLNLGLLRLAMGDHVQSRQNLARARRIAEETQEPYDAARAEIALGHLDLVESNLDEACRRLDAVLADRGCQCDDDVIQASWLKALVECSRGGAQRALEIAEEARKLAHEHELVESEADCCRALATAYARLNDRARAAELLRDSIDLSAKVSDPYRHGLAVLDLGLLYAQDRRVDEARANFAQAERVFLNLGARFDCERARNARAQIDQA